MYQSIFIFCRHEYFLPIKRGKRTSIISLQWYQIWSLAFTKETMVHSTVTIIQVNNTEITSLLLFGARIILILPPIGPTGWNRVSDNDQMV